MRNRKMREREITKKGDRCRDRKREMGARKGRESVSPEFSFPRNTS